jgi:ATP-binding cassette subfamily C (CFTR/MRP) protein 1
VFQALPSSLFNGSAPPLLSECYQHTFLVFVPCVFLWIFTPVILYALKKSQELPLQWSFTITTKIVRTFFNTRLI